MATQITTQLRGFTLKGEATDMDSFFVAGLMMPRYGEVLEKESGLFEAFQAFSVEHNAMVAAVGDDEKGALMERLSQSWAERVILRLNTNLSVRSAFAQRMREVFPAIPKNLIDHKRWNDKEGNIHEESSIRLDVKEIMELIAPIAATMQGETVAPQTVNPQDELADLRAQIVELQKGLKKQPKGFKPVEETVEA